MRKTAVRDSHTILIRPNRQESFDVLIDGMHYSIHGCLSKEGAEARAELIRQEFKQIKKERAKIVRQF